MINSPQCVDNLERVKNIDNINAAGMREVYIRDMSKREKEKFYFIYHVCSRCGSSKLGVFGNINI